MLKYFDIKSWVCKLTFYVSSQKFGRKNILCALRKKTNNVSLKVILKCWIFFSSLGTKNNTFLWNLLREYRDVRHDIFFSEIISEYDFEYMRQRRFPVHLPLPS
jgi:hypothetical protein